MPPRYEIIDWTNAQEDFDTSGGVSCSSITFADGNLITWGTGDGIIGAGAATDTLTITVGVTKEMISVNGASDKIDFGNATDNPAFNFLGSGTMAVTGALTAGSLQVGAVANYTAISAAGVVTMVGTAKRVLTLRPDFDHTDITGQGKPTEVVVGVYRGFSLPLYAADEEVPLFINVPGRWDGLSDIIVDVLVALSAAETAGDDFRLQLSWSSTHEGSGAETAVVLSDTPVDVEVETNIPDARKAQYNNFLIQFTINWDVGVDILSHDLLSMRLRRIAVEGGDAVEIDGEIIILDAHLHFAVDKMFKAP